MRNGMWALLAVAPIGCGQGSAEKSAFLPKAVVAARPVVSGETLELTFTVRNPRADEVKLQPRSGCVCTGVHRANGEKVPGEGFALAAGAEERLTAKIETSGLLGQRVVGLSLFNAADGRELGRTELRFESRAWLMPIETVAILPPASAGAESVATVDFADMQPEPGCRVLAVKATPSCLAAEWEPLTGPAELYGMGKVRATLRGRLRLRVVQPEGGLEEGKVAVTAADAHGTQRDVELRVSVPLPRPELRATPAALQLPRRRGAVATALLESAKGTLEELSMVQVPAGCTAELKPFGAAWRLTLKIEDESLLDRTGRVQVRSRDGKGHASLEVAFEG